MIKSGCLKHHRHRGKHILKYKPNWLIIRTANLGSLITILFSYKNQIFGCKIYPVSNHRVILHPLKFSYNLCPITFTGVCVLFRVNNTNFPFWDITSLRFVPNTVSFFQRILRIMSYLLWVHSLYKVCTFFLLQSIQYLIIMDRNILRVFRLFATLSCLTSTDKIKVFRELPEAMRR